MIGLITRLLIAASVTVSVSVVTVILLMQKFGATWNVVPVMVFAIMCSRNTRNQLSTIYIGFQNMDFTQKMTPRNPVNKFSPILFSFKTVQKS